MAAIFETSHLFVRRYTSFPRPMFSRVRNAMKLLFLLYVFPRTMFSRVRNAMKLSFFSYDDGLLRSKVQNRPNLTLQITFRLGIWIRFIGFRQNLAWTHYLTLGIILWKNFSFLSKSKMAAGGQKLNFDIISAQKSHFGLANGSL